MHVCALGLNADERATTAKVLRRIYYSQRSYTIQKILHYHDACSVFNASASNNLFGLGEQIEKVHITFRSRNMATWKIRTGSIYIRIGNAIILLSIQNSKALSEIFDEQGKA
jgi:hypothetical protein